MTYYKFIMGNRSYTTKDAYIERMIYNPEFVFIDCTTTDGKKVIINKRNVLAVEVSDEEVREPSEIEQIVDATLNGLFGNKPKQIDTIDLGESTE